MDKVQHFEIPVDDIARARAFYETVFSWSTSEWPSSTGGVYIGLQTGPADEKNQPKEPGYIGGGMFQRTAEFPLTHPSIAITVDDIDATVEKIKNAGGSVAMEKIKVGDMGLFAYVKDTENNLIGIWQAMDDK